MIMKIVLTSWTPPRGSWGLLWGPLDDTHQVSVCSRTWMTIMKGKIKEWFLFALITDSCAWEDAVWIFPWERRQALARSREEKEATPPLGFWSPALWREGTGSWSVGSEDHECEQVFMLGHEQGFQVWWGWAALVGTREGPMTCPGPSPACGEHKRLPW